MQYLADDGTVIYSAKDGKDRKVFDAPEWLAAMCSHVPNPGEQMVRYYGYYSNVTRGKRQNEKASSYQFRLQKILAQRREGVDQPGGRRQQLNPVGQVGRNGHHIPGSEPGGFLADEKHDLSLRHVGHLLMGVGVGRIRICRRAVREIDRDHHQVIRMENAACPSRLDLECLCFRDFAYIHVLSLSVLSCPVRAGKGADRVLKAFSKSR